MRITQLTVELGKGSVPMGQSVLHLTILQEHYYSTGSLCGSPRFFICRDDEKEFIFGDYQN